MQFRQEIYLNGDVSSEDGDGDGKDDDDHIWP